MINRVELRLRYQAHQMGELDSYGAAWFQQQLDAGDEVVDVADLCQHVGAADEVRLRAGRDEIARCFTAKQLRECRHAPGKRHLGDVLRGVDAEGWDTLGYEIL